MPDRRKARPLAGRGDIRIVSVEKELEVWLRDRHRRRSSVDAAAACAKAWRKGPVRQMLDRALGGIPDVDAEAAAQIVCNLFADHGWAEQWLDTIADQMRSDPMFEPPFRNLRSEVMDGLVLYESEPISIAAGVVGVADIAAKRTPGRKASSLTFSGQMTVIKFVRAGGAELSFWEAPRITADFSRSEAGACRRVGARRLSDDDIVVIDGRRQSYIIEQARANLFVLIANIAIDQAPLRLEYDSAGLSLVGCSAASDTASRIQMIATLVRKLNPAGAFEALERLLDHPDFFVRWHVIRELLGVDARAALPHLKRMAAGDPHVEVRRNARTVLDRLEKPARRKAA